MSEDIVRYERPFSAIHIREVGFSRRLLGCLQNDGITTLAEAIEKRPTFRELPNCGPKSIREFDEVVAALRSGERTIKPFDYSEFEDVLRHERQRLLEVEKKLWKHERADREENWRIKNLMEQVTYLEGRLETAKHGNLALTQEIERLGGNVTDALLNYRREKLEPPFQFEEHPKCGT